MIHSWLALSQHHKLMTSEVALLNNSAVALAADSAMTLAASGKIYPAQKLFAVSEHHPVGMMVFNNAAFMGIPWETLIKMYRDSLDDGPRPSIEVYLQEFLEFIANQRFITTGHELENLWQIAEALFQRVASIAENQSSLKEAIQIHTEWLQGAGRSFSITAKHVRKVLSECRSELNDRIELAFSKFDMTDQLRRALVDMLGELLTSDIPTPNHSGLVVAGFGHKEFFPTLVCVTTEGTVGGKLKFDRRHEVDIARDGQSATIVPFAQREMVQRFMEGVDPMFLNHIRETMGEASSQLVIESLKSFDIDCTDEQINAVKQAAFDQATSYLQEAAKFREREFVDPIMEIVQHLPKEELADMAEALVNLTALKRRVSLEAETVGGPIDVAVISKGDGFVWIRRKQYIDQSMNPSYIIRR